MSLMQWSLKQVNFCLKYRFHVGASYFYSTLGCDQILDHFHVLALSVGILWYICIACTVHVTLSSQLLLNLLGDFNETWYKERSHIEDVHVFKKMQSHR